MQNYKNLDVWQKAHILTVDVYKITMNSPKEELYGLTSQIRRACVSIPANIAEGCGREGDTEFGRFLKISLGSANELEYYFTLTRDLKFIDNTIFEGLFSKVNEVKGMLITLIKKLKA